MAQVAYDVIRIPLDIAGEQDITLVADYFNFIDARNTDGSQNLDSLVEIAFGKDSVRYAPVRLNTKLRGRFDQLKLRWSAQPGVTAIFYVAATMMMPGGAMAMELEAQPPKQLVTLAVGTAVVDGSVSVGAVATLIRAANALRQSLTIQNNGAVDVFIGSATVVAGAAVKLAPGASMEIAATTGAIYGITAAGTADVAFLSEES